MSFERFKARLRGDLDEIVSTNTAEEKDDFLDRVSDMSKLEIDRYVEENFDIHLDRRQSKKNMIKEFKSLFNKGDN